MRLRRVTAHFHILFGIILTNVNAGIEWIDESLNMWALCWTSSLFMTLWSLNHFLLGLPLVRAVNLVISPCSEVIITDGNYIFNQLVFLEQQHFLTGKARHPLCCLKKENQPPHSCFQPTDSLTCLFALEQESNKMRMKILALFAGNCNGLSSALFFLAVLFVHIYRCEYQFRQ